MFDSKRVITCVRAIMIVWGQGGKISTICEAPATLVHFEDLETLLMPIPSSTELTEFLHISCHKNYRSPVIWNPPPWNIDPAPFCWDPPLSTPFQRPSCWRSGAFAPSALYPPPHVNNKAYRAPETRITVLLLTVYLIFITYVLFICNVLLDPF